MMISLSLNLIKSKLLPFHSFETAHTSFTTNSAEIMTGFLSFVRLPSSPHTRIVLLILTITLFSLYCQAIQYDIQVQSPRIVDALENRRYLKDLKDSQSTTPHAPLYRGMGTHFVYIWVGTPPQRVSVIIDTGSHYTAFPCKGCTNCGVHTDHYWDPKSSKTSITPTCGASNCRFSQSYTEGSSWQAYKVTDVVWIGGERSDMIEKLPKYSVNFTFGCQTSETGLFRTQVENGIMGLSCDPNTLPYVLHTKKLSSSRSFNLCLLSTGGLMSIDENNEELNLHPMKYAHLLTKSGYYTISVENILFKMNNEKGKEEYHDLNEPKMKINTGKGIIVDSGTTDSYLPSSLAASFRKLFQKLTGILPTNSPVTLTHEQYRHLPTIIYRVTASSLQSSIETSPTSFSPASAASSSNTVSTIDIEFPPWNYYELQKDGKYVMRLYLTESSGGVIGANMMIGHNILFDIERQRVGFAKSECKKTGLPIYDEVTPPKKIS